MLDGDRDFAFVGFGDREEAGFQGRRLTTRAQRAHRKKA
jgi:hypothetical protein